MAPHLRHNKLTLSLLPWALVLLTGLTWRLLHPKGALILWMGLHRSPNATSWWTLTDKLGEEWAYLAIFIILLLTMRLRYALLVPVLGTGVAALSAVLKQAFQQPRPKIWFPNHGLTLPVVPDHYVVTGFSSFPSGHTFSAFAVFTYLALCSRSTTVRLLCVALATLGGLSRIYFCQHFLEDVLFGAVLGTTLAYAVFVMQMRMDTAPERWWNRQLRDHWQGNKK